MTSIFLYSSDYDRKVYLPHFLRISPCICKTYSRPNKKFVGPEEIDLTVDDIDDPHIKIDVNKLQEYRKSHLVNWLKYRGDSLRGLSSLKDYRLRVLHYVRNKQDLVVCDPTPDRRWIQKKARENNVKVMVPHTTIQLDIPGFIKDELNAIHSKDGWTRSLEHSPTLSLHHITEYVNMVQSSVMEKTTTIKKSSFRGNQLLAENYIDVSSVYTKSDQNTFLLKGICAASLRNKDRHVLVALTKDPVKVVFANCQCPAGQWGTCSHTFALLKLIAIWSLENQMTVPEPVACTSKPCTWSVPQSRGRVSKDPLSNLTFKSLKRAITDTPDNKKSNNGKNTAKERKLGIESTLYDARSVHARECKMDSLKAHLESITKIDKKTPALHVMQEGAPYGLMETKYGEVPVGSPLSIHCPFVEPGLNVYAGDEFSTKVSTGTFISYPPFPLKDVPNYFQENLAKMADKKTLQFLDQLKFSSQNQTIEIEKRTVLQSASTEWHDLRKHRFTASMCNQIAAVKTDSGLNNLAKSLCMKKKPVGNFVQQKFEHGHYFEPIARQKYDMFLRSKEHVICIESSGLVINENNFMFAATPDGKVVDISERDMFGIMEIKCSKEYHDVDPGDIMHIARNSCLIKTADEKIKINPSHSYFDQIQMQLALTGAAWCDFIFYTGKGLVIDRVRFHEEHWKSLSKRIGHFYFDFYLPLLAYS